MPHRDKHTLWCNSLYCLIDNPYGLHRKETGQTSSIQGTLPRGFCMHPYVFLHWYLLGGQCLASIVYQAWLCRVTWFLPISLTLCLPIMKGSWDINGRTYLQALLSKLIVAIMSNQVGIAGSVILSWEELGRKQSVGEQDRLHTNSSEQESLHGLKSEITEGRLGKPLNYCPDLYVCFGF